MALKKTTHCIFLNNFPADLCPHLLDIFQFKECVQLNYLVIDVQIKRGIREIYLQELVPSSQSRRRMNVSE